MVTAEKKLFEKIEKTYEKSRSKNQSLNIRRLAFKNNNTSNIDIFKEILSDPPIENLDKSTFLEPILTIRIKNIIKKKAKGQMLPFKYFSLQNLFKT